MNRMLKTVVIFAALGNVLLGCNNQDEEIRSVPRTREKIGISVYGNGANATILPKPID